MIGHELYSMHDQYRSGAHKSWLGVAVSVDGLSISRVRR
jgi:hypothetical protein